MYMRDLRKVFELEDSKLQDLVRRLEEITNKKFNEAFADNINNFIGILREKYLIDKGFKTNKTIKREIEKVRKALIKIVDILDNQTCRETEYILLETVPEGFDKFHNHSYNTFKHSNGLIKVCDLALENLKNRNKIDSLSFIDIRDAMAVELARELDAFGIDITAYRDGIFSKALRCFLESFIGEADGVKFSLSIPEDMFEIIQKAKNEYNKTERFVLLQFR